MEAPPDAPAARERGERDQGARGATDPVRGKHLPEDRPRRGAGAGEARSMTAGRPMPPEIVAGRSTAVAAPASWISAPPGDSPGPAVSASRSRGVSMKDAAGGPRQGEDGAGPASRGEGARERAPLPRRDPR